MKFFKYIPLFLLTLLLPTIVLAASAVGWSTTSTSNGFISPNKVNGVQQGVGVGTTTPIFPFVSASTTAATNAYFFGNMNNFVQNIIQNDSSGNNASALWLVCNDLSGVNDGCPTYFGEFGINGSGYSQAGFTGQSANDVFINASDSNLDIGTASSTGPANINFFTAGTLLANNRMIITSTGLVGVGTSTPWALSSIDTTAALSNGSPSFAVGSSTRTDFVVLQNGNVGIGTTTPTGALTVVDKSTAGGVADNVFSVHARSSAPFLFGMFNDASSKVTPGLQGFELGANGTGNQGGLVSGDMLLGNAGAHSLSLYTNAYTNPRFTINSTGNVAIGSTSPSATLSMFSISPYPAATGAIQNFFLIASSTLGAATTTNFAITASNHIFASSTAPTVSSGSVDGTDQAGRVLGCSSACTVTFAVPYTKIPSCIVVPESGSIVNTFSYVPSATTLVVTETGLGTFDYQCRGQ